LAVETAQKALELASSLKQDKLIGQIRMQLEFHKQEKQFSL